MPALTAPMPPIIVAVVDLSVERYAFWSAVKPLPATRTIGFPTADDAECYEKLLVCELCFFEHCKVGEVSVPACKALYGKAAKLLLHLCGYGTFAADDIYGRIRCCIFLDVFIYL